MEENVVYKPLDNGFEKAAGILGIASVITAVFGLAPIPLMLGGIAIILAFLSRGKGPMSQRAIRGVTCGVVGITINIALVAYVIFLFFTNSAYRQIMNAQAELMYGYSMEELIESSFGTDIDLDKYLK